MARPERRIVTQYSSDIIMPTRLRCYGLASVAVMATAIVRYLLIPVLGNRFGFDLFLISTFICSRYLGFGPSVFALLAGALPVTIFYFVGPDLHDPYFLVGLSAYLALGAIVALLGKSEHDARSALQSEIRVRHAAENAVRTSEARLQEREERLRMAVESADIGTWDFNVLTGQREWSDRSKAMFGLPPDVDLNSVPFADRVHPDDREQVRQGIQKALDPNGDGDYEIEYRIPWPDGTIRWITAKGQALFEGQQGARRAVRFIGTVLDITERRRAEDIIRASESRLKAMMDNTLSVIYLKDLHGRYLMVNRRFEELCNFTQQQIVGKTAADIFPSDVVARLQANDQQVRDTGQPLEFEEVVPHGDGPHTYVSIKFPIIDSAGRCTAVGGISTDISERKRAIVALEEEQELLRHTIELQDQERQLVAYEIHDGLVQYATGALMQLESIQDQVKSQALSDQIDNVLEILRKTVNEGRRIINGIHTTILDDCGVVAAVQQLIEDEERAHVRIEFNRDESLGRLAPNIELAIYHITQEALTNSHKHSRSDKVRIDLGRREDRVHLEVRDWGVGFTPPAGSKDVHGLRGMTERARIVGGKCTVQNARGKGTLVVADLPYVSKN